MNSYRRATLAAAVALIAMAIFGYFHRATSIIAGFLGTQTDFSPGALAIRALVALIMSMVIVWAHRRDLVTTTAQALSMGLQLAVIVGVIDHLLSPPQDQTRALMRTASALIGLPLLLSVSHLIMTWLGRGDSDHAG